jgi:7-cyano-7-deazaguanine synthase
MRNRKKRSMPKAVVLLSGGLDSSTCLYFAKKKGFSIKCLIFDYNQRHKKEVEAAKKICSLSGCGFKVLKIDLPWKGSSLLDKRACVSKRHKTATCGSAVPSTYVPGRNIIFLSYALSYAEAIGADAIFIGANAIDYSGYPDCRPEFYRVFQKTASCGTKAGVEGKKIKICAPLIKKTKAQIIKLGKKLGVPFQMTWSCYAGGKSACGKCDSCYFRAKGFRQAGIKDPALKG